MQKTNKNNNKKWTEKNATNEMREVSSSKKEKVIIQYIMTTPLTQRTERRKRRGEIRREMMELQTNEMEGLA